MAFYEIIVFFILSWICERIFFYIFGYTRQLKIRREQKIYVAYNNERKECNFYFYPKKYFGLLLLPKNKVHEILEIFGYGSKDSHTYTLWGTDTFVLL